MVDTRAKLENCFSGGVFVRVRPDENGTFVLAKVDACVQIRAKNMRSLCKRASFGIKNAPILNGKCYGFKGQEVASGERAKEE
jgi:hypothetical protein